ANTYDFPLLLKEFLGLNLKIVTGYHSSADIMLAIERKEADGGAGSLPSTRRDLAPTPRATAIMGLRSAPEIVGRPYVMHPNTSPEHLKIMREAFAKAIDDKALVAEATKANMGLNHGGPHVALKVMKEMLAQPKDVVEEFSKYVK